MTSISRQQAFELLEKKSVHEVRVHFSGGNDEGDVESVILRDARGEEIGQLDTDYYARDADGHLEWGPPEADVGFSMGDGPTLYKDGQQHHALITAEVDAQLSEVLQAPVFERYGSFAGDFSVYGDVVWRVPEHTVEMDAQEC